MTSGTLGPWLIQIVKIGMLTFLFAIARWQICWTPMKIWRFQNIESHAILFHFVLNKKLMQIKTYLITHLINGVNNKMASFPNFSKCHKYSLTLTNTLLEKLKLNTLDCYHKTAFHFFRVTLSDTCVKNSPW